MKYKSLNRVLVDGYAAVPKGANRSEALKFNVEKGRAEEVKNSIIGIRCCRNYALTGKIRADRIAEYECLLASGHTFPIRDSSCKILDLLEGDFSSFIEHEKSWISVNDGTLVMINSLCSLILTDSHRKLFQEELNRLPEEELRMIMDKSDYESTLP